MGSFPKSRVFWITGVLLVCIGALMHSHAESWATFPYPLSFDPTGKSMYLDYPLSHFLGDSGIAMMVLGGIGFTCGLVAWVYPPPQVSEGRR